MSAEYDEYVSQYGYPFDENAFTAEQVSYFLVIHEEEITLADAIERLSTDRRLDVLNIEKTEDFVKFAVEYQGRIWRGALHIDETDYDPFNSNMRQEGFMEGELMQCRSRSRQRLTVTLEFTPRILASLKLQFLLSEIFAPKMLLLVDTNAYCIYHARACHFFANLKAELPIEVLYGFHGVAAEEGEQVWIHTHGLYRAGLPDIEIIGLNRELINERMQLVASYVRSMVDDRLAEGAEWPEPTVDFDDFPADKTEDILSMIGFEAVGASFNEREGLGLTTLPWQAVVEVEEGDGTLTIGGLDSREDGEHTNPSGALVGVFLNGEEDERDEDSTEAEYELRSLDEFNDELAKPTLMIYYSDEASAAMRELAAESTPWLEKAVKVREVFGEEAQIIVKAGLAPNKSLDNNPPALEHCWFNLESINGDTFRGRLMHDVFYIEGAKEGDVLEVPLSQVSDWSFLGAGPGRAYQLDMMLEAIRAKSS